MRRPIQAVLISGLLLGLSCSGSAAPGEVDPETGLVPPRVISEPTWTFPENLAKIGIRKGTVGLVLSIGDDGSLVDFLILGCTNEQFADAVAAALPTFRFAPALKHGEPTMVRLPLTLNFQENSSVVSMRPFEAVIRHMNRLVDSVSGEPYVSWLCPKELLDHPLVVLHQVTPRYPGTERLRGEGGEVTLDFYVDQRGKVRMTSVLSATQPTFAAQAVAALETWEFEPARSRGEKVIVHVSQTFNFYPPDGPLGGPSTR